MTTQRTPGEANSGADGDPADPSVLLQFATRPASSPPIAGPPVGTTSSSGMVAGVSHPVDLQTARG